MFDHKAAKAYENRLNLAWTRYTEASASLLHDIPPSRGKGTIVYLPVMGYVVDYIERQHGSTRSIDNAVSNLRVYCTRESIPWLTDAEAYTLKRGIDMLKLEDLTPVRQAAPFTRELLLKMVSLMDLSVDEQLMQAAMAFIGHDAILRGGELFGGIDDNKNIDRRLRVRNFEWSVSRMSVIITLVRTKTERWGSGARVELVDPGNDTICGISLLRRWFTRKNLWKQPDAFAFPQFIHKRKGASTTARMNPTHCYSKDMLLAALRGHLVTLGLNPFHYRGHSFRSGGATDLFDQGVPLATIMEFGRWRDPASCLRYYRRGAAIAREVAHAFVRGDDDPAAATHHKRSKHSTKGKEVATAGVRSAKPRTHR